MDTFFVGNFLCIKSSITTIVLSKTLWYIITLSSILKCDVDFKKVFEGEMTKKVVVFLSEKSFNNNLFG